MRGLYKMAETEKNVQELTTALDNLYETCGSVMDILIKIRACANIASKSYNLLHAITTDADEKVLNVDLKNVIDNRMKTMYGLITDLNACMTLYNENIEKVKEYETVVNADVAAANFIKDFLKIQEGKNLLPSNYGKPLTGILTEENKEE